MHSTLLFCVTAHPLLVVACLQNVMCFATGMGLTPKEASIFSPLPPKQTTNVPLTDCPSAPNTQLKGVEVSAGNDQKCLNVSPIALSPLTISARDIDGGSADFTEFCTAGLSFSEGNDDFHTACQDTTKKPQYVTMPFTSLGQADVDCLTPLRGTSSPLAVPVRVRISASKLREVPSPNSSVSSRCAVLSEESSFLTEGNTPRAPNQPPVYAGNQKCRASRAICVSSCVYVHTHGSRLLVYYH